jgi:hypothetical protein
VQALYGPQEHSRRHQEDVGGYQEASEAIQRRQEGTTKVSRGPQGAILGPQWHQKHINPALVMSRTAQQHLSVKMDGSLRFCVCCISWGKLVRRACIQISNFALDSRSLAAFLPDGP